MTKALVPVQRETQISGCMWLRAVGAQEPLLTPSSCSCPRPPPSPSGTITAAYGQPQNHSIPVYEMKFPDLCVY